MSFVTIPNLKANSVSRPKRWVQKQNLTASSLRDSNRAYDWFSSWMSIDESGETLVVGAMLDEQNGTQAGSAYIFRSNNGVYEEIQKITATDSLQAYDQFGQTLQISRDGTVIGVASQFDDQVTTNAGAIYIFHTSSSGYVQRQKVTASFGTTLNGARLGYRDIKFSDDKNYMFVGAASQTVSGVTDSGAVYVFHTSSLGYRQVQVITIPLTGDGFGYSISLNSTGNKMAIGAVIDGTDGFYAGSVYIYESGSSGFFQTQYITPDSDTSRVGDVFGSYVNMSRDGNTLAISSTYDDQGYTGTGPIGFQGEVGAVYIYTSSSSGFQESQKLFPTGDENPHSDHFGYVTWFSDDSKKLLIGSENDDENGIEAGSAYLFTSSSYGYVRSYKFLAQSDISPEGDTMGTIVAINNTADIAFVSAIYDEDAGTEAGSVYVYKYE